VIASAVTSGVRYSLLVFFYERHVVEAASSHGGHVLSASEVFGT
jgi:hypothetical protein